MSKNRPSFRLTNIDTQILATLSSKSSYAYEVIHSISDDWGVKPCRQSVYYSINKLNQLGYIKGAVIIGIKTPNAFQYHITDDGLKALELSHKKIRRRFDIYKEEVVCSFKMLSFVKDALKQNN